MLCLLVTGQGQADYSAAWAAYYQQLYQQQAVMAAGQAPGMRLMETFHREANIKRSLILSAYINFHSFEQLELVN